MYFTMDVLNVKPCNIVVISDVLAHFCNLHGKLDSLDSSSASHLSLAPLTALLPVASP